MATQKQNFVDQQVRPVDELLEKMGLMIGLLLKQEAILDPPIVNDSTPYDDGRPDENLDQFTEGQLTSVINGLANIKTTVIDPAAALIRTIAVRLPI
jgi:hypothetical protein